MISGSSDLHARREHTLQNRIQSPTPRRDVIIVGDQIRRRGNPDESGQVGWGIRPGFDYIFVDLVCN